MAKNKVRKPNQVVSTKGSGRRLSNNNTIVFVAILISAALIGSSVLFAVGSGYYSNTQGGGATTPTPGANNVALINSYQEALKKNPDDIATREQLGIAYYTAGTDYLGQNKAQEADKNLKLAIVEFEKVLAKEPKKASVLGDLAVSYHYTGNTDKAIEIGKKALEADPNLAPARMNLGIFLASKQKYAEAITELKKVPSSYSDSARAKDMIKQYQELLNAGKK